MSIEMSCGQCDGRILIETPGVIVACPHCGVHLSIPAEVEMFAAEQSPPISLPEPPKGSGNSVSPPVTPSVPQPTTAEDRKSHDETIVLPRSGVRSTLTKPVDTTFEASVLHNGDDDDAADAYTTSQELPHVPPAPLAPVSHLTIEQTSDASALTDSTAASIATGLSWIRAATNPDSTANEPTEPVEAAANLLSVAVPPSESAPPSEETFSPPLIESSPPSTPEVSVVPASPALPSPPVTAPSSPALGTMPDFSWMSQGSTPATANTGLPSFQFDPTDNTLKEVDKTSAALAPLGTPAPSSFFQFGPQTTDEPTQNSVTAVQNAAVASIEQSTVDTTAPSGISPVVASVPSEPVNLVPVSESAPIFETTTNPAADPASEPILFETPAPARAEQRTPQSAFVNVLDSSAGSDSRRPEYPTTLLIALGSYASLVTIYLAYLFFFGRTQQLESLPDLKTVQQQGGRAAVPRPENVLPPGHDLKFGQSERYGNIRVTPLRVTRGPLTFTHYTGNEKRERLPSDPVLKLWLKFENVSNQQTITPLDPTLMFFRRDLPDRVVAYNVIFRESDRKLKDAPFHYLFDRLSGESEWRIVGQHTNESLGPLASFETFIPSEEGIEGLDGDLVWRVHFRKGYGPQSGNGVTTLIDVHFKGDDVRPDDA